jgi:hypothetical protein
MTTKSGSFWVTWANAHAQNSNEIELLVEPFRSHAIAFVAALRAAGARVDISTTTRSRRRAYLFHWSWKIALGKCRASDATSIPGVDILWDHGNEAASKRGAQEMVTGFGLAVPPKSINPPALTSNHIEGLAIDMDVTWSGTIKVKDAHGADVVITHMEDVNLNTTLHRVGASYGVRKLATDAPHWSHDGH